MKIQPQAFAQTFVRVARDHAPDQATAVQLDRLQETPGLMGRLQGLLWRPRPEQIEAQSRQALSQACQILGPSLAGVVAQKVGMELFTPAHEVAAGQDHQQKLQGGTGFEVAWSRVSRHATRDIDCKTVDEGKFGPAMFMGQTVFLNAHELQGMPEEVQLFLIAHEVGHVEHRHSAGKVGLSTLTVLEPNLAFDPNVASKEMEFAADRRAAEIAAREGCRPHEILRTLMGWLGGNTHPEGVDRARAVRQTMAEHGATLSDGEYEQLLQETEVVRQQARAAEREQEELLSAFRDLV